MTPIHLKLSHQSSHLSLGLQELIVQSILTTLQLNCSTYPIRSQKWRYSVLHIGHLTNLHIVSTPTHCNTYLTVLQLTHTSQSHYHRTKRKYVSMTDSNCCCVYFCICINDRQKILFFCILFFVSMTKQKENMYLL